MKNRKKSEQNGVFAAIRMAAGAHPVLTAGTLLCVAGSVGASLVPPLLLARIIDRLTAGIPLTVQAVLLYFGSLALEGGLSSAQESLLVLFGQKMTHALRTEMSRKLTRLPASMLVRQNPGEVAARFSGDVDTVEALFTSGIISMAADACRIVSILAVIAVKNTGLALILLLVLPLFALFTRHVQKRMLAAQLDNRRAVAAVSGQVPETLHNIRTIRALGLEAYREQRYDRCIGDSYAAMERTNFYDAIYSPVVLVLNAVVVGAVMLLSASGNAAVLTLFGMSVGTSVAVINYISRIFEPIESLGMEIQTIQSAMAGVKRIDAFPAGSGHGDHRRGEGVGHHRPGAPHLHRLCGAASCPGAGHGAGADHPGRPGYFPRNGPACRRAGWDGCRHPGAAAGLRHPVHRRHVLAGRMAAAVHCPRRRRRPGGAAAGRDHGQSGCRDRGPGPGSPAPCFGGPHGAVGVPPHLRKPRRADRRDPDAGAGMTLWGGEHAAQAACPLPFCLFSSVR